MALLFTGMLLYRTLQRRGRPSSHRGQDRYRHAHTGQGTAGSPPARHHNKLHTTYGSVEGSQLPLSPFAKVSKLKDSGAGGECANSGPAPASLRAAIGNEQ